MMKIVTEILSPPPVNRKEILRYAGGGEDSLHIKELLDRCLDTVLDKLSYKICYTVLDCDICSPFCDFGAMRLKSEKLALNLQGCRKTVLFGATVGMELDRLIAKYSRVSLADAVMLQAIGAERIEALCDMFCQGFENENGVKLRPRFSPGYGDLHIETQRQIFDILGCQKNIGLYLNESMLMLPTKSVTAFAGVDGEIKI